ncbi:MAG: hypothetical protein M3O36_04240 [Myxococcota bacterium]|nr:hypothetical protein [Myxococcota bacterium]
MMEVRTKPTASAVQDLRALTGPVPYADVELRRLLEHVGDLDLAACALAMSPRPSWVLDVATRQS